MTYSRALTLISLLLISACKPEERNYNWFLQHPLALKQQVNDCQSGLKNDKAYCDMIMQAAVQITEMVNAEQENPEQFGQQVLSAQEKLAELETALAKATDSLQALKQTSASSAELKLAQDKMDALQKAYDEESLKIKTFLAVLGLSSPE